MYLRVYYGLRVAALRLYNTDRIYKRLFGYRASVGDERQLGGPGLEAGESAAARTEPREFVGWADGAVEGYVARGMRRGRGPPNEVM